MSPEQQQVFMLVMGLMVAFGGPVVQCPKTTTEGKDGDTVILSCSTKNKTDISHDQVEWLFEDPTTGKNETVHTYSQREDQLDDQNADFRHRTSLFNESFYLGNCSLSLKVNAALGGRYYCCVVTDGKPHCCPVDLKVLPKGEQNTSQIRKGDTPSPGIPNNGTDGLTMTKAIGGVVGGIAALLLLIGIITLAVRLCSGRKPDNPRPDQPAPPPQDQDEERIPLNEIVVQGAPADDNEPATGN